MADDREDEAFDLDQMRGGGLAEAPQRRAPWSQLSMRAVPALRLAASMRSRRLSASAAALGENQPHRPLMF